MPVAPPGAAPGVTGPMPMFQPSPFCVGVPNGMIPPAQIPVQVI